MVRTNLENLPMQIADYQGSEDRFPDSVYEELNADAHLYRHYRHPNGNVITLYIGYYGTAKGGRTGHNPYACLPGAGWGIINSNKVTIQTQGKMATVNAIVAQKGDVYETVLHWYQSDKDKVLATGIQQNIQRFLGRVQKNRNDGAFVRLSMLTPQTELGTASSNVRLFAEKIMPLLPNNWPEEQ